MEKKPKRTVLKPPGKCIFCGGGAEPGNPMSAEHLWSDWMASILPQSSEHLEIAETFTQKTVPIGVPVRRMRQGSSNTKRIKVVCQNCNNNWMSKMEAAVKPILTPLILGQKIILSPEMRITLTEWIVLKILVAEHNSYSTSPADPIFDQDARNKFMGVRQIPPWLRIWIGLHNGTKWSLGFLRHTTGLLPAGEPLPPNPRPKNVSTVTFGMGHLLIQAFATTSEQLYPWLELSGMAPRFRALWPLADANISWPGFFVLTDRDGDIAAALLQTLIESPRTHWVPD